jgi:hypothetical protein
MTISSNYPSINPSLNLDFANGKALDPRITFSRPTTATYYNATTSAVAEQNLLFSSQVFTGVAQWSASNVSFVTNSIVAPDGTTTATTLTSTSSVLSNTGVFQSATFVAGSTASFYAKAGTSNYAAANIFNVNTSWATFNLSAGTVSSSNGCTASIVSVGNGWYRCVLANLLNVGASPILIIIGKDADPAASPWLSGTWASGNNIYIWGAQLEQRSSVTAYTPTTTTSITNYIPVLLTQQSNEARFDHNPVTRESLGLLIEEQRTNLLTYSSQFDNAIWGKTRASITSSATVAPDGTQTAQKLVEDSTASNSHYVLETAVITNATSYTVSVYAKAAGRSWLALYTSAIGTAGNTFFDLTNGVVGAQAGGSTASIVPVGNGWYRCSISGTSSATSVNVIFGTANANNGNSYSGDGFSGIYIWGAQLEAGAFATSYIPTVASQVTRSADSASMTGTNFSSWYNSSLISLYAQFKRITTGINNQAVFQISGTNGFISIYSGSSGTLDFLYGDANGVSGIVNTNLSSTTTNSKKIGFSYVAGSLQGAYNGTAISSATPANVPSNQTALYIGWNGSANQLNGWISKISYYPSTVTSVQLQGLTG